MSPLSQTNNRRVTVPASRAGSQESVIAEVRLHPCIRRSNDRSRSPDVEECVSVQVLGSNNRIYVQISSSVLKADGPIAHQHQSHVSLNIFIANVISFLCILVLAVSQGNTDISLLYTRFTTVYFQLPLQ